MIFGGLALGEKSQYPLNTLLRMAGYDFILIA